MANDIPSFLAWSFVRNLFNLLLIPFSFPTNVRHSEKRPDVCCGNGKMPENGRRTYIYLEKAGRLKERRLRRAKRQTELWPNLLIKEIDCKWFLTQNSANSRPNIPRPRTWWRSDDFNGHA